jgi:hypothetical protein
MHTPTHKSFFTSLLILVCDIHREKASLTISLWVEHVLKYVVQFVVAPYTKCNAM